MIVVAVERGPWYCCWRDIHELMGCTGSSTIFIVVRLQIFIIFRLSFYTSYSVIIDNCKNPDNSVTLWNCRNIVKWATAWQNLQNDMCTQRRIRSACTSAQSDQSLCCLHVEILGLKLPVEHTAKTLIRLVGCPHWSESSLGAQILLLVLSCDGSLILTVRFRPKEMHPNNVDGMAECWLWLGCSFRKSDVCPDQILSHSIFKYLGSFKETHQLASWSDYFRYRR